LSFASAHISLQDELAVQARGISDFALLFEAQASEKKALASEMATLKIEELARSETLGRLRFNLKK